MQYLSALSDGIVDFAAGGARVGPAFCIKAADGCAVMSTKEVEIQTQSVVAPFFKGRLWDQSDITFLEFGKTGYSSARALAAVELTILRHR